MEKACLVLCHDMYRRDSTIAFQRPTNACCVILIGQVDLDIADECVSQLQCQSTHESSHSIGGTLGSEIDVIGLNPSDDK